MSHSLGCRGRCCLSRYPGDRRSNSQKCRFHWPLARDVTIEQWRNQLRKSDGSAFRFVNALAILHKFDDTHQSSIGAIHTNDFVNEIVFHSVLPGCHTPVTLIPSSHLVPS